MLKPSYSCSMDNIVARLDGIPFLKELFHSAPRVPVIRLNGIISDSGIRRGGISYSKFSRQIEKAFKVKNARAVVLVINSPGGAPAQASLVADAVRQHAGEKELPVYAFIEDVAASGGYWLACAGDEIYAQGASIVGSIGVISASFGLDRFIARHDIDRRVYTEGRDKSFLDPFQPESQDDVKRLKVVQKDMHKIFIGWVKERRGEMLKGTDKTLFEGAFWSGVGAQEKGLIDGIGDMRSVIREKYGEKVRFVEMGADKKFLPPFFRCGGRSEWAAEILDALEQRSVWNRYGL